jgi:hypothetical protein
MEPAPKPVAVIEAEVVEEAEEEAITPLKTAIGRRVSAEAELAQPE